MKEYWDIIITNKSNFNPYFYRKNYDYIVIYSDKKLIGVQIREVGERHYSSFEDILYAFHILQLRTNITNSSIMSIVSNIEIYITKTFSSFLSVVSKNEINLIPYNFNTPQKKTTK